MDRQTTTAFAGATVLLDQSVRDQLRLSWRLLRDERVSAFKYLLPALLTLYVLSPVDPIPDFFLGIGQMDDLGVVVMGILLMARAIPKLAPTHIVDEHLRTMRKGGTSAGQAPDIGSGAIDADFDVRR